MSKSETRGREQRKRIRSPRSQSRDQADGTPFLPPPLPSPPSPRFEVPENPYMDKVIDVPGALQAGFNSPDRPQTVEIHAVQFVDAEVNISVNMLRQVPTERKARRSCSDTALNDVQTSSIHRSRKFTRHSSERRQTPPNIMRRQVRKIQKVQSNRCLARR